MANKTPRHRIDAAQARYWRKREEILAGRRAKRMTFEGDIERLLKVAKNRAKKAGLPFELTPEWVLATAKAQDYACTRTGIPFVVTLEPRHPFQMSVDRKDSNGGYTVENAQLVCLLYNTSKQRATDEQVYRFAQALVDFSR